MAFMFENLQVYPKAVDFADKIASHTEQFPRGYYFLVDQLDRAALSIATNLAEGNDRFTKPDRKNFFTIARGCVQECVPLLEVARRRGFSATVPGTEATLVGVLTDPFATVGANGFDGAVDPRLVGSSAVNGEAVENSRAGVVIREIDGTRFLYDFDQHASAVNVYRFLPNSQFTVFCAELARESDRANTNGDDAFYIWTDTNGDGIKQSSEETFATGYQVNGGPHESVGESVDSNGDIWIGSYDNTGLQQGNYIREYLPDGLNSIGAPIYTNYKGSNTTYDKSWAAPAAFTELTRAVYNAATDTLYLSGYTTAIPRPSGDGNYGLAGTQLMRVSNWTASNNGASATPAWTADLPYTANSGSDLTVPDIISIDIAGNYVFAQMIQISSGVLVYQANNGSLEPTLTSPAGTLVAGPAIGTGGIVDFRNGMNATELSNGQYEIFVEDSYEGKSILDRWTPGVTLPTEGWTDGDIGKPSTAGSGSFNDTTYGQTPTWTVNGSGTGLAGTSDQFNFASTGLTLNGSITADVTSITTTSGEAGVMIRDSSSPTSLFADCLVSPSGGIVFQWRATAGSISSAITLPAGTDPELVRLFRVGNLYTASYSTNGTTFTQIGQETIAFTSVANQTASLAGLAVTSQNASMLATATFTNVVVANPTIGSAISGAASPITSTSASLTVVGADPSGTSTLSYAWATTGTPPAAVSFSPNASTTASNTTATFTKAGAYTLQLTITDAAGFSNVFTYALTVAQTACSIAMSPAGPTTLAENATQQFTAKVYDQFGVLLVTQPTIAWTLGSNSVGTLSTSTPGLYTAPASAGSATVVATAGTVTASTSVTVDPAWLSTSSLATWNTSTHVLTVSGATSIIADPGTDEPIIEASGASAVVTLNPASDRYPRWRP
jgi:four helix bundle protein